MTPSWLYQRIAETGVYDELQLRIVAKHHYRDLLIQALFDGLPQWWQDDIRTQWKAAQKIK